MAELKRATVFVKAKSEKGSSQGTGFFVKNNLVATNAHVLNIEDPWKLPKVDIQVVIASGTGQEQTIVGTMVGVDVSRDIAFVSLREAVQSPSIKFLKSETLTETLPVYVLGFPLGTSLDLNQKSPALTIVSGQVSGFRRDAKQKLESVQVNASLIPGNSGGPIVDSQGKLVGISRATVMGTKLGFAIPADAVEEDLRGRIGAISVLAASDRQDPPIEVKLRAIDPLKRIHKTAAYYWTSEKDSKHPLDRATGMETHGAPGDSQRQHLQLTGSDNGLWSGLIPNLKVEEQRELWVQPAISDGTSVRLLSAVNYSREQRERDQKMQAVQDEKVAKAESVKPPELREFNSRSKGIKGSAPPTPRVGAEQFAKNVASEGSEPTWESAVRQVRLSDKKIIEIAVDPHGDSIYAIFENDSQVSVYDTSNFQLQTSFNVARFPESICWINNRLVVAAKSSRVVQFIDTKTYEPVHAVRVIDRSQVPNCIVGEAPDGSAMTIWSHSDAAKLRTLYLVDEKRDPLKLVEGKISWCTMLPRTEQIIVQSNETRFSAYTGEPVLWTMARRAEGDEMNFYFHDKPWNWNRCGRCLFDRRLNKLVLPACYDLGRDKYDQLTHFFKADGTGDPEFTAPGYVVSLLGPANTCISLELRNYDAIGYYVDPTAGEVTRQIQFRGVSLDAESFAKFNTQRHVEFIPGRELLLMVDQRTPGAINVAACAVDKPVK